MGLSEVTFRLQHKCPYNDLSRRHPTAVMAMWCNYGKHFLEISCENPEQLRGIQGDFEIMATSDGIRTARRISSGTHMQIVIDRCDCMRGRASVNRVIDKCNCLEIPPTIYTDGWERYRVIAFRQRDLKDMFFSLTKFSTLEILSRRTITPHAGKDAFLAAKNSLLSELTKKQLQALLIALDSGYYNLPKKITTEQIARRLGVPRSTYEEHLRKAESKILRAATPFIQMAS
ncbi:MAG: helix-turn-helix domain-containing protein [Thaumarchaeota archaeon]|nr:helix-turn-helix domain-containing protein [Nitrososphaerota archaeon]